MKDRKGVDLIKAEVGRNWGSEIRIYYVRIKSIFNERKEIENYLLTIENFYFHRHLKV